MSRREFIRAGAAAAAAAGIAASVPGGALFGEEAKKEEPKPEWKNKQDCMKYRRLGRTNLMVSEIGFGAMGLMETNCTIVFDAMEKGVNYIDTASSYVGGRSEKALADVVKKSRDKFWINTKTSGVFRRAEVAPDAGALFARILDESLGRLKTDRVDGIMVHGAENADQVGNDDLFNAFEKAKKAGKARFFGVSCHQNMAETLKAAVETGRYDLVMSTYNVANSAALKPLLDLCEKKDVGFVAMKAAKPVVWKIGQYLPDSKLTPHQTCFKWVLESHKAVSTVIPHMVSLEQVKENVRVPKLRMTGEEESSFRRKALESAQGECCSMCGGCAAVCDRGVRVPDIMRFMMYLRSPGEEEMAREGYASLGPAESAAACDACMRCLSACPMGIDIPGRIREAHSRLTV